jgi:hypothetical protein
LLVVCVLGNHSQYGLVVDRVEKDYLTWMLVHVCTRELAISVLIHQSR